MEGHNLVAERGLQSELCRLSRQDQCCPICVRKEGARAPTICTGRRRKPKLGV